LAAVEPPRYDGGMPAPTRERLTTLVATAVALAGSALVLTAYLAGASALVAYPWDWSPDEGLHLDYARRFASGTAPLYPHSFVPFPSVYGPLLPALLAPTLGSPGGALVGARLQALGWVLAGAAAVYALIKRRAPALLALAGAALSLAALDVTFWHMLIRPDGPMTALWLLAALPLLPSELAHGADRLSPARLAAGVALLGAACLAKPTAALYAAPLVLGWAIVDRRGALRLLLGLALAGLTTVLALQWVTGGGFLWVNRLWSYAPARPWLPRLVVSDFLGLAWPLVLLWLVSLLAAGERRTALRDGSVLLLAGALLVLPLTAMSGASWNYLVPLVPALAVATGRSWAGGGPLLGVPRATAGAAIIAGVALVLCLTRKFPLPTPEDERTARVFYSYVRDQAQTSADPILAVRPELAYFQVGQPVEVEGASFFHLARGGAPGMELVEERLAQARYSLVIWTWPLPDTATYREALERSYAAAGGCKLGYYFGSVSATLLPRRDLFRPMLPQAGTRCGTAVAALRPTH
jgi:hypothetical protein